MAAPHLVGEANRRGEVLQARMVEFVPEPQRRCAFRARDARPRKVRGFDHLHVAAAHRPLVHHDVARNRADHLRRAPAPADRTGQVHQAAAFGVGRQAGLDRGAQFGAQRGVRLQIAHRHFREAAADEQAVDGRQVRVAQRVERHQPRAGGLERGQVVGVVEAERRVARDADAHARCRRGRAARTQRADRHRRGRRGDVQHAVKVDLRGHRSGDAAHARFGVGELGVGHQAEVALRHREVHIVLQGPQHRHVGVVLDHGAQLGFVARAAELVQDHAGDAHVALERLVAQDQRRDAARHAARIDHQQHRQTQLAGKRRIAVAAVERQAVVQALVALDQAHIGGVRLARERGDDLGVVHQVRVEVETRPAAGAREPHRVDVVGAFLEGLHAAAARGERFRQADRQRGLARRLVGRGDEQAR